MKKQPRQAGAPRLRPGEDEEVQAIILSEMTWLKAGERDGPLCSAVMLGCLAPPAVLVPEGNLCVLFWISEDAL